MKRVLSSICFFTLLLAIALSVPFTLSAAQSRGDVNDDNSIDMKDVLFIRKYMAHMVDTIDTVIADTNGDESVDMKDVLLIRKYMAHMDVTFAPLTPAISIRETPDNPEPDDYLTESLQPSMVALSFYDMEATKMGVTWHTTKKSDKPICQYIKVSGNQTPDFSKATIIEPVTDVYVDDGMSFKMSITDFRFENYSKITDYAHHAVMDNLDFNSTYAYRVGDAEHGFWSDVATFKTREQNPSAFSFIFTSDTQVTNTVSPGGYKWFHDTLTGAYQMNPNFSFIMHGGDIIQQGKYIHQWQVMYDGNKDFLMKYPMMIATGNHESTNDTAGDYESYKHTTVDLPDPNSKTIRGIYYSFDYGDAHFMVLNTSLTSKNSIDKEQKEWLTKDLAATNKKWKIIMLHAPLISSKNCNNSYIAAELQTYGVDVVLQAHEHVYMRSYPYYKDQEPLKDSPTETRNGIKYYLDPGGTIYSTFATGGPSDQSLKSTADLNNLAVAGNGLPSSWGDISIDGNTLTVKTYYYNDGNIQLYPDGAWGIIKNNPPS